MGESDGAAQTREVLDSLVDPIVVMRAVRDEAGCVIDFSCVDANAAACAANHRARTELVGRTLLELFPSCGESGLLTAYARVADTGVPLVLERQEYRDEVNPDESRYYDIHACRIAGGITLTWRDATDQEHTVAELVENRERFQLLAEHASDVLYFAGVDRRIEWVSPAIEQVLGWRQDQIVGTVAADLFHPDDRAATAARRDEVYSGARALHPGDQYLEIRVRHADGSYRWMHVVGRPIRDHAGTLTGVVFALQDVDDLVRARAVERRTRLSMDEAAIGLLTTDVEGSITYANPAALAIVDQPVEGILGRSLADRSWLDWSPAHLRAISAVLEGRSLREHLRESIVSAEGSQVWLDLFVGPLRSAAGDVDGVLVQMIDVTQERRARDELAASARHYRLLAENASDVVYETDAAGLLTWVSSSVEQQLGWTPESLLGTRSIDLVHPDDAPEIREARAGVYAGRDSTGHAPRFRTAHGEYRNMSISAHPVRDDDGVVIGAVAGLHDVTDEMRMRKEVETSELTFRTAMHDAPQGMVLADLDDIVTEVNPAAQAILGREGTDLIGSRIADLVVRADARSGTCAQELLASRGSGVPPHEHELLSRDSRGRSRWVLHSVSLVRDADASRSFFVHHLVDVSEAHHRRLTLEYRASHDLLTSLLNREGFTSRLRDWLSHQGATRLAVLFCDVDGLKDINDAYGHASGDAVLRAAADRISGEVRRGDLVGRLGGDEFVVALDRVQSPEAAREIADKICAGVRGPVVFEGSELQLSMSVGLALATEQDTSETLVKRADAAVYRAKAAGGGRTSV